MFTATRVSRVGSEGGPEGPPLRSSKSTQASRRALPLVSSTKGLQPCERTSSPVSSNIRRLSHPIAPGPATPALVHSVWFASWANARCCVGKQVLMSVNLPDAGSYIDRCRPDSWMGNAFADGCDDPALQKSGFALGRTRGVNHTRPRSSIIGLWLSVLLSQIGSAPQCGDGAIMFTFVDGVAGSRTGCRTCVAVCVTGSRTGTKSLLSSGDP